MLSWRSARKTLMPIRALVAPVIATINRRRRGRGSLCLVEYLELLHQVTGA